MPEVPVMQAVVDVLESEGVDVAFGCPGAAILPLYAAMEHRDIKHLIVRHEEGATHMADGWARTNGKVGVAIGTSGPAGTNMITGLYTAQADSIPMLCITGQAVSTKLHQEAFQAVDIVEIAKPVTKWAVQVKEAAQAPWIFREAFRIARSGRPGPVLIDLPLDVQKQEIEWDPSIDAPLPVTAVEPHLPRVERALDLLLESEKPLILAGGGIILGEAHEELRELAELLNVPVQTTLMGKGSFPEDHELFAGMTGIQTSQRYGNQSFMESDLVLALGARFGDRHTGAIDVYRGDRKFIHVDIEPTQIGKVFGPDLGIVSDTRLFLRALLDAVKRRGASKDRAQWVASVVELKRTLTRPDDYDTVPIKAPRVFREINALFDPDTYFVTAIGLYQIWSGQFQSAHKPRHYQVCGQAGPLGWEIPAAIGVKAAKPDAEVAAVVGDYGFQFLVEELAVAAQYNVPFVIIMLNNEYLGLIRQAEGDAFGMNTEVDIHYDEFGTDNVKVMEAYGCSGRRVIDPADLADTIEWARKEAVATSRPVLVEVMIEREANTPRGIRIDAMIEPEEVPNL
ncbi:tartronate-semialdehyde synthase [Saccharopolyspora erythraea NRRL 2338]|uniref:Glyoxylate carboligase n=2 Tax=Saccharopolyspora erythraea TaxID=1836 RepID=A4FPC0_SACEN|nr:glyoxylate carboligase [Saccharopolyspora erythraea]EQD86693.1 glyoxylate carboligase [Saccharopolyspora erythraea D]PFG99536.1 tartronate-semialdehyde synthase [Saccharopolyspora erythraea NRRL 2338]QRK89436.1 glyoxylate carboligase [Saccharopolyspora erythraea]CAM05895.1 glyoxylate carboligase [Saccharopolyspora erythraea NRRL 2338]